MQDTSIDLGAWEVTEAAVREYLSAVGDDLPVYLETGTAPPLMLAARVVGRLLERLSLPDGAIHSLQDVETVNATRVGAPVSAVAEVGPARERGGMRFLTVDYIVTENASGFELMKGRTTVLLPATDNNSDQPGADGC